jgi:predicted hydrolase (HD superfamily)
MPGLPAEENQSILKPIMNTPPTRAQALALLDEYITIPGLKKHCLAVEAVMRHFARKNGEDEEKWGIIGMLHDMDYEKFPDRHCHQVVEILRGWPAEYVRAIQSHGWNICTDVPPESRLEKTLYATDELSGLIIATALVKPSKSVLDVDAASVLKKFKTPSFAAKVDRAVIQRGAEMLGIPLEDLVAQTIVALQESAETLGLKGSPAPTA